MAVFAAAVSAEQQGESLPRGRDGLSWSIWVHEPLLAKGNVDWLVESADHVSALARVVAAHLAGKSDLQVARATLSQLLNDPDPVVRRVAGESFFGRETFDHEIASQYDCEDVLAAEVKGWEIAQEIRRGNLMQQYRATEELIALRWPAIWQIHMLCHDANTAVARSAQYAFQEVNRLNPNVAPLWANEIERQLEQKVVFELRNETMEGALRELSALSGVAIRWSKEYDSRDMAITLRGEGMTVRRALLSVIKMTDTEYRLKEGGIEVYGGRLGSGAVVVMLDVRDLRAAGLETGWEERLLTALRRHRTFIDHFREFEGFKPWSFFGDRGGLLRFDVPCHSSDQANEMEPFDYYVKPILAYLNELREERGLPSGAE